MIGDTGRRGNGWQSRLSERARRRRGRFLTGLLSIPLDAEILDLGGGTGSHIHAILPEHRNITVCDISDSDLAQAREKYGYRTVQLTEAEDLPFSDRQFDFCFCSSVIEHVTGPKAEVTTMRDDGQFRSVARAHQKHLAAEISRIARAYYVQTPYRYFVIESHTWLPGLIVFLPRRYQIAVISLFNRFWFKKTSPDWYLLDRAEMAETFPEAKIYRERYLLLTKSLMAIKAN